MKQAKLKSFFILVLFAILSTMLILATTSQDIPDNSDVFLISPSDDSYWLNSTLIFSCGGGGILDWNITSVSLWGTFNETASFNVTVWNTSHIVVFPIDLGNNTAYTHNFTVGSLVDGRDLTWSCGINYTNMSGGIQETLSFFPSNRTVNIEFPPTISLLGPTDDSWVSEDSQIINFSVTSIYTTGTGFDCYLYSNDSAPSNNWSSSTYVRATNTSHQVGGGGNVSDTTFTHIFEEGRWHYGIWCAENADNNIYSFSNNFTINVDTTAPVVAITSPATGTYQNDDDRIAGGIDIVYTVTDVNPDACILYENDIKTANLSITSATFELNVSDAHYSFIVSCNDTANTWANSSAVVLYVDTDYPSIDNIEDGTPSEYSDRWTINFTSDEDVNYTIYYGLGNTYSQPATISSISSSTRLNDTETTLKELLEDTVYTYNISVCDEAGNCNTSYLGSATVNFTFPFKIFPGWSYFGIYDALINLSRILDQSQTEYAYWWNQTNQAWVYSTAGGSSNMDLDLGTATGTGEGVTSKHVVVLYEDVNSTWDRNISVKSGEAYEYNITSGDNFLKMYRSRTMGQIAQSLLNTSTYGNPCIYGVVLCQTPEALTYNLTQFYFSAFNNTANTWTIDFIYNWSWNNATTIGNVTPYEVAWIYSPVNITWNGSNIIGNWSI